jgi:hypothetical protein
MVLSLSICALIFSVIALVFSVYNLIQLEAQKRSTHSIEYVGANPGDLDIESTLADFNKKTEKELEETLPFFNNEDTKKVRSF